MARIGTEVASLPFLDVLLAVVDITRGKPRPEGYRVAADRLGIAADEFVVLEDSAAGMEAGGAVGCQTIGIGATRHLKSPYAEHWIEDLNSFDIGLASSRQIAFLTVV